MERNPFLPVPTLTKYLCHKVVEAAKIHALHRSTPGDGQPSSVEVEESGGRLMVPERVGDAILEANEAGLPPGADLGYVVRYADGYVSWSPTAAFEDGYSPVE